MPSIADGYQLVNGKYVWKRAPINLSYGQIINMYWKKYGQNDILLLDSEDMKEFFKEDKGNNKGGRERMSTLTICLIICALTILGFIWGKWSMATVSLCSMILFILTGCVDSNAALANFGNTNGIMLMSMFVVAAGFRRTQFVHTVSSSVNKLASGNIRKIMAAYIIITIILSQFIQSPVVVFGIMSPMLAATCSEMNISPSKVMYPLGIAAIATCSAFPLGSGATVFAELNAYLEANGYTEYLVTLTDPMKCRLPVVIACAIYCIFFAIKLSPEKPIVGIDSGVGGRKAMEQKKLPPFQEKCGYIIFIAVTIALIVQQQLSQLMTSITGMGLATWQICFIGALLVVMSGVLTPKEATDAMPVWMYLLLVGSLTMGTALQMTGAGDVIGNGLAQLVGKLGNQYLIGMVFFLVPFLLTQFMQNRTVMMVFIPIAILACKSMGANPVGVIILVQSACLTAFVTPMATPAVPQYMAAGGYDLKSVLKQSMIPCALFCVISVFWTMTVMPMF